MRYQSRQATPLPYAASQGRRSVARVTPLPSQGRVAGVNEAALDAAARPANADGGRRLQSKGVFLTYSQVGAASIELVEAQIIRREENAIEGTL